MWCQLHGVRGELQDLFDEGELHPEYLRGLLAAALVYRITSDRSCKWSRARLPIRQPACECPIPSDRQA